MGAFGQGLVQGSIQGQAMINDLEQRKQQAELFKLKSKQLKLETDMQEKQLAAQNDLPNLLFKGPDMQPVEAQGPGAPVRLPMEISDNPDGYRLDERWGQELVERGPGAYEEGKRPTGMAEIPNTAGPWANLSPQLQSVARSILTSTGGDVNKTMQTLQMLAPGVFPKPKVQTKLGPGDILNEYDPNTNTSTTLASGTPKEQGTHVVNGNLVRNDGTVLFTDKEKPGDIGKDIKIVDGKAYRVVMENGEEVFKPVRGQEPKTGEIGKDIKIVDGKAYRVVMENGEEVFKPVRGQEEKEPKSPVNPVDQYIYAQSGGRYHNMAEAAAAGETELIQTAERVVREQRPLERAVAVGQALTAELPQRERQKQEIALEKPLAQEKRANLFDRKAFLEGKNVRPPAGITEGQAAKGDYIEITDKQMEDVKTLDNATSDMGTLFSMADRLITAKDWKEANFKQFLSLKGGAFSGMNSEAATYEKDVQAFSTNLARAFGHEKGVMTDQDIARWVATIPTFRDTVKTKEAKKAIFNEIKQNAIKAQRRAIAGDDLDAVRADLQQKVQPLLKRADAMQGKNEIPPVPEKFRHLPKEDQDRWQPAYMDRLNEVGAAQ